MSELNNQSSIDSAESKPRTSTIGDVLAALARKQAEADTVQAMAEAHLQNQIDQLAAKYQRIHDDTLARMRYLPADDDRWQLLSPDKDTKLPAMVFYEEPQSNGDYGGNWVDPYYITYEGEIYYKDGYGGAIVQVDPTEPSGGASENQQNMHNTIIRYERYIKQLGKFHDSLPTIES